MQLGTAHAHKFTNNGLVIVLFFKINLAFAYTTPVLDGKEPGAPP
jgi:hypothetical protein